MYLNCVYSLHIPMDFSSNAVNIKIDYETIVIILCILTCVIFLFFCALCCYKCKKHEIEEPYYSLMVLASCAYACSYFCCNYCCNCENKNKNKKKNTENNTKKYTSFL